MIYFLYGNATDEGTKAAHKKARDLSTELCKKKPDASLFTLNEENWNESAIEEYTASQGLFEKKYIVVVQDILTKKDRKETFLDSIELFAESPNIFIVVEPSIDKTSLKKIEKHAAKVQEFAPNTPNTSEARGGVGKSQKKDFVIFDLADALGSRNKKRLWLLYREAIDAGKVPEEIHGILFWQVKAIAIAMRTGTPAESGLNPFVYRKAKDFSEQFNTLELRTMMQRLVSVYHDAHRGLCDFETALEMFILEL